MLDHLKYKIIIRSFTGLIILLGIVSTQIVNTSAQSNSVEWSSPINLSHSGSTKDPQIIVDSNGIFHVIWIDDFDGYIYAQSGDGIQWSTPIQLSLPFVAEDSPPLLLSDTGGFIHAFWIDADGTLYYSHVLGSEFGNPASWVGATSIAESALDFDATLDSTGVLHLSYVRPLSSDQFPAGIYYRNSSNGGDSWSIAISLYQSKYFRSLNPEDAHVQISSTSANGQDYIFVAWDDRSIKRVFLTKSFDGGQNWEATTEIDGPSVEKITTLPFNIIVQPYDDNVLAIWQSGLQSGFDCNQYFQWSQDRGNSWSERQLMLENLVGCPDRNKFLRTSDGTIFLWTIVQEQAYLLAWSGTIWSEPLVQTAINNFTNPDTLEGVNFRCRQPILGSEDYLFVVGCDTVSTKDIWFTSYALTSLSSWFPSGDLWSTPEVVTTAKAINNPHIAFDSANRLHLFWSQSDENTNLGNYSIYYAQYENNAWSQIVKILSTPKEQSEKLSIAYDEHDRLLVVWESSGTGEIRFSWANASKAINPFEWSNPISLPTSSPYASSPDIIVDNHGDIIVAYSIKINEGRGIYISKSTDGGTTWEEPVTVFDAIAANWELVDEPKLAKTDNGNLYIIWKRFSLVNGDYAIGLYYSKSEDDGISWSIPEAVTDQNTTFANILGFGTQRVHRFWQSEDNDVFSLWHQVSRNGGNNWDIPENLSGFGETPLAFNITEDDTGRIYLAEAVENLQNNLKMNLFTYADEIWVFDEGFNLVNTSGSGVKDIAINLSSAGNLAMTFIQDSKNSEGDIFENLYFSNRFVQIPISIPTLEIEATVTSQESPTQEAIPSQESIIAPTITITPTIETPNLVTSPGNSSHFPPANSSLGLIVGGLLSILLVGTVFLIGLFKIRRSNR